MQPSALNPKQYGDHSQQIDLFVTVQFYKHDHIEYSPLPMLNVFEFDAVSKTL